MGIQRLLGRRRGLVVAASISIAFGVGFALVTQQAQANTTSTAPNVPKVLTHQKPILRASEVSGNVVPSVTATNAHCGQTITASLTLNGDLVCSGNGLTVSGSSVVLNLNGHEISGSGGFGLSGIDVTGKSDTVENGIVTNFSDGVDDSGTTDTVTKLRISYIGQSAIYESGNGNKLTANQVFSSQGQGIVVGGVGTVVSGNRAASNSLNCVGCAGIFVAGTKDVVTGNIATGSALWAGIEDYGFDTTLTGNVANFNGTDGIYVNEAGVIDGGGNLAKGNNINSSFAPGQLPRQCYNIVCN